MRSKSEPILIIGAGVFGLSTALELKSRGYEDITILDRVHPPVPDGSSVDVSRVIRNDYADPLYARMANEAQSLWETEFREAYHKVDFLVLSEVPEHIYLEKCKDVLRSNRISFYNLSDAGDICKRYTALRGIDLKTKLNGYVNPSGGWADAASAIQLLARRCTLEGISFITGPRGSVLSLRQSLGAVAGVNVASGPPIFASTVIIAAGAWSCRLVDLTHDAISTSQPVGFLQLTPKEANEMRDLPIFINFTSGFFSFPIDPSSNRLKVARHGYGYENEVQSNKSSGSNSRISAPFQDWRRNSATKLPKDADRDLRRDLRIFFPELADRPWADTRMCWYTDTQDGDFVVDNYPSLSGVFLATGGSGHAFKFLPVLGRYVVDCFENRAPKELRSKWAIKAKLKPSVEGDGSRGGPRRRKFTAEEIPKL